MSQSSAADVRRYIENQEEHHRRMTFQNELRALYQRHEMEFDERYVWDGRNSGRLWRMCSAP